MKTFPKNLGDTDHATFDMGLMNAARVTRRRLETEAFREGRGSEKVSTYSSLRIPWWLEMEFDTPWTMKEYGAFAAQRIAAVLDEKHGSHVDARQDDVRRMIQHWSHEIVWDSVPLHVGYVDPETDVPYTANDILERAREKLRWVSICQYMDIKTNEDPLWSRSKPRRMSEKLRHVVDATRPQMAAARYLIGPEMNIKNTSGPGTDVIREALPYLLSVEKPHARVLSTDLRDRFRQTLAAPENQNPDQGQLHAMKTDLTTTIIDIWMEINATATEMIIPLQEQGKPDVLNGNISDVFNAYVRPHLETKNEEKLRALVPLIGYHTIGAVGMDNIDSVNFAIRTWSEVACIVTDLPSRIIDLAFIACRVMLADNAEELRALKLQMQ